VCQGCGAVPFSQNPCAAGNNPSNVSMVLAREGVSLYLYN